MISMKNEINMSKLCLKVITGNQINPEIEMDGDPIGFLPCKIVLADDYLDLVIKRE